jgi:hypothetical protein
METICKIKFNQKYYKYCGNQHLKLWVSKEVGNRTKFMLTTDNSQKKFMCDIQNNGKIQREFETRSTDDQPTIQWLPVVGSWTFLGVNMHFNEKLFMCDSCNFLVRAYHYRADIWQK